MSIIPSHSFDQRTQQLQQLHLVRVLQSLFAHQARDVLLRTGVKDIKHGKKIDLSHWLGEMVKLLGPYMYQQWVQGMKITSQRLTEASKTYNLPPPPVVKSWSIGSSRIVTKTTDSGGSPINVGFNIDFNIKQPKIIQAVDEATFDFCKETLATVEGDVNDSILQLKQLLKEGLSEGEATSILANKIRTVFTDPTRAYTIAANEQARFINAGRHMAAVESGVVESKRWEAGANACVKCRELHGKTVPLNEPFIILPKGGPYAIVMYPPLHPHCFCSWTEILGRPKPGDHITQPDMPIPPGGQGDAVPVLVSPHSPSTLERVGKIVRPLVLEASKVIAANFAQHMIREHVVPWATVKLKEGVKALLPLLVKNKDYSKLIQKMVSFENQYAIQLNKVKEKVEVFRDTTKELLKKAEQVSNNDRLAPQTKVDKLRNLSIKHEAAAVKLEKAQERKGQLAQLTKEQDRQHLIKLAQHPNPIKVTPTYMGGQIVSNDLQLKITTVTDLLSKLMGPSVSNQEHGIGFTFGVISPSDQQRSYNDKGNIWLTPHSTEEEIAHHIGHVIEDMSPKAAEALRAFWYHRCKDAEPVNLRDKFGNHYDPHEVGHKGRGFEKLFGKEGGAYYAGKKYPNGQTELLAMGLELLLKDPRRLMQDREFYTLIMMILGGKLR